MATNSSIANSIKKPFTANKRLFTLLTVAFVIIGLFFSLYYSFIKTNELNLGESKLQSLDSDFDIISKQLTNEFQKYYSTEYDSIRENRVKLTKDNLNKEGNSIKDAEIRNRVWNNLESLNLSPIFEQEFSEYIVIFKKKGPAVQRSTADSVLEISSLKGRIILPDTLNKPNPFNIGLSMGIPKYQLFGREYRYTTDLDDAVLYEITIIGMMETELYNEATRKLDPWVIALLGFFLLLALFGMPYFKMLFIAEDERISTNDIILAGISIIVGAPIIMIVFLSMMNHYDDYFHRVPQRLATLGQDIKQRMEYENKATVMELNDMFLSTLDTTYLGQKITDTVPSPIVSETNAHRRDYLKFVSKINSSGKVSYHVRYIDKDGIKNTKNLSSRPYFKDMRQGKNVWFLDTLKQEIKYVIRPVVSIEDQTEEAVYILANEKDSLKGYRVGASQLKSIHESILPFGFQFAIVDDIGEVWFHSEKRRATLENFLDVSRNNNKLKAAIAGRVKANGLINYRDTGKLFHVLPLKGSNLSVITMYDIGLLRTRISEVLTLACLALVMAIMLMLVITILSLAIRNPKLGLYKYDRFLFEFLTPKREYREAYILLSMLFFGVLLISMVAGIFVTVAPTNVFIICLLLAIYTYLIVFYTLHPYRNTPDVKFRVRDALLLLSVLFLNFILFRMNQDNLVFFGIISIIQIACIATIIFGQFHALPKKIKKICSYNLFDVHISHQYWYAIFLFCWLSLASVYPAYLFFEKAKAINDQVWLKTDQIYMANKFLAKKQTLQQNLPSFKNAKSKTDFKQLHQRHLEGGQYHEFLKIKDLPYERLLPDKRTENFMEEFLWKARPIYNDSIGRFQALIYPFAHDNSWHTIESDSSLTVYDLHEKGAAKALVKKERGVDESAIDLMALKVSGILLILIIFFSLILFFSDRFFGFRFRHLKPSDFNSKQQENNIAQFVQILNDESSNSGILLIGLPFSGKGAFAKRILKASKYDKMETISMLQLDNVDPAADIPDILNVLAGYTSKDQGKLDWEMNEAFIIEHLEHNIKSFEANHTKLRVILFLISRKKRIVLISEVYPSQIFAMYEKARQEGNQPQGVLEDDFNSWRNILSAFPQVLIGITENSEKVNQKLRFGLEKHLNPSPEAIAILEDELGYSKFLPSLAPIVMSKTLYEMDGPHNQKQRLDRQRMVMHTQNLAHGYYNDIWNALPTRERYLLYDLAKDGFMNIKNRNSLFSLMKKGLIVWRDRPAIFNYSFKNFIMTSVSLDEALRLEYKNRSKGTWASTRILLYLVIITAIVFIALGKPELLKDFEAVVGTLGGLGVVIPLVSKLLASVGQKS